MKPQTRKQAEKKVKELMKDLKPNIIKECNRLINSGALPLDSYENTFELPKCVLMVALENMSAQYEPFSDNLKKEVKNLRHF